MLGCPFADWRHRNVERWHWKILQKTWRTEGPISFWYVQCFARFPAGSPLPPVELLGSSFSWIETEVWLTRRQWRCCCRTKRPVGTFGCLAWKFSTNKRNKQQKQLKHVKFQSKTVRSQLTDSTSNQFKSIDVTALNRNSRIYLRCFMNFHDWILWWDKGLRRDELGENPCENPPRLQRFCDGALSKCGIQTLVNCKRQASLSIVYGRFVQNRWPRHAQTWFSWNQRANGIGTFVWSNWGLCPRLWDGSHSWVPSRQVTLTLVTSWCKVLCKWIHLERKAKPFTACSILDTWWMNRLRFTCFTCAMSWTYDGQAWTVMQRSFQMHLKLYEFFDSTSTWTISPLYWKKALAQRLPDS